MPAVQALLGHASPQMTLRVYSHLKAEGVRSWVEGMNLPGETPAVAPRLDALGG